MFYQHMLAGPVHSPENVPASQSLHRSQQSALLATPIPFHPEPSSILSKGNVIQRQEIAIGPEPEITSSEKKANDDSISLRDKPESQSKAGCNIPKNCPAEFCKPFGSKKEAESHRSMRGKIIMMGISAFVDSRVVPLWKEYMNGGSSTVKDLTKDFSADFQASRTTKKTTDSLVKIITSEVERKQPPLADGNDVDMEFNKTLGPDIAHVMSKMDFNIPGEIPGNIAGGIGNDQTTCKVGANPSPQNDERNADVRAKILRKKDELLITPQINFEVKDTIDLCPGNCGTSSEQIATVPLSRYEATGIAGDVPFLVKFQPPKTPGVVVKVDKSGGGGTVKGNVVELDG